ncbi:hypothetical protein DPMN_088797 [Dreissena polymorpha]|uniref:Uncharacterized protein n=1 Tax=Dreissena polymorpha TaxID=45954 RepID=A0A9D4QWQ7_DREPO|nr:hypothetical protein DPMN_088797 [Dreissena polymorpha]
MQDWLHSKQYHLRKLLLLPRLPGHWKEYRGQTDKGIPIIRLSFRRTNQRHQTESSPVDESAHQAAWPAQWPSKIKAKPSTVKCMNAKPQPAMKPKAEVAPASPEVPSFLKRRQVRPEMAWEQGF